MRPVRLRCPQLTAKVVENMMQPGGPTLDGFALDASAVVDLAEMGALAPLEQFVLQDSTLAWTDVLPYFRQVWPSRCRVTQRAPVRQ
jgi:hypothetical protein